jgi:hypothetical protein
VSVFVAPAVAQGAPSEAELFGEPADEAPIVPDEAVRDADLLGVERGDVRVSEEHRDLLEKDRMQVGGMLYLRSAVTIPQRAAADPDDAFTTLSMPNLLDVYLDGRPNDRVRAFARGRVSWDPAVGYPRAFQEAYDSARALLDPGVMPELRDLNAPRASLDQLWLNFDVARRVWVTVGKQPVRFGATRLWNPADLVNATHKDPLDFFDARSGVSAVKVRVPIESLGWNVVLLALTDQASAVDDVAALARLETVFSSVELGVSASYRRHDDVRAALDLSAGVGDVDLTAEVGTTFLTETLRHRDGLLHENVYVQAALGLSYTAVYNADDLVVVGVEGFWNPDDWLDRGSYAEAYAGMLSGQGVGRLFRPFYLGKYYGAAYVALPGPGSWDDVSFTLTTTGNLTDRSFLSRFDTSIVVLTYLTVQAYVQAHYGQKGGEFRFGFDSLTFDPGTGTPMTVPVGIPYQMVDFGVNLKVDF